MLKKDVLAVAGNCYIYVSNEFSTVGWYEMGMIVLARCSIHLVRFCRNDLKKKSFSLCNAGFSALVFKHKSVYS